MDITEHLSERKRELAEKVTTLHFKKNPALDTRYGKQGREKCMKDIIYHLDYLIEALRVETPEIFIRYLEWATTMLQARGISKEDIRENIASVREIIAAEVPDPFRNTGLKYLDAGITHLKDLQNREQTYLLPENPLYEQASEYLDLLLGGKRQQAGELIWSLAEEGVEITQIYEHIFETTQKEIGVLWQQNKITVAHEHYCTAATQLIMSRLYPRIFSGEKNGYKLVACSVSNELHEIGIRMVADFFEMDGWDTYYMGSNVPEASLLHSLREHQADIFALSVTLPVHIGRAESLIRKIRSMDEFKKLKILAGGYPFGMIPGLFKKIGADATARSAKTAVYTANELTGQV